MIEFGVIEKISKNEYYLSPGHNSHTIGFTLSGILKSYFNTKDGGIFLKSFITPFEICASFQNPSATYNSEILIQAITDVTVLNFKFQELDILRNKSLNLERMTRKVLELEFWRNEKKEYFFITRSIEENYLEIKKELGNYFSKVKQKEIANYLGITEVALSRIKKRMNN